VGFKAEKIALEDAFRVAWANRTPIFYEEVPSSQEPSEYVKIWITPGTGRRADLGNTQQLWRFVGTVSVDIVVPQDTGTTRAKELGDIVMGILLGKEISGIQVYSVDPSHDRYKGKYIFKLHFSTRRDEYF